MAIRAIQLIPFNTIIQEDLPPIDWLVEGLIANGERVIAYGEPRCGKSWLLLALSIAIATGRPWLGRFEVPQPKKVVYFDEEMNQGTLRRRLKRLGMSLGEVLADVPLRLVSHHGLRAEGTHKTIELLIDLQRAGFDPDVIIVETMRQALVGSENEAPDVRDFWNAFEPLRPDKTLIVSHHMRKPSTNGVNDARNRASGSTYIIGGCDTAYAVTREDNRLTVECVKAREIEEPEAFQAEMVEPEGPDGSISLQYVGPLHAQRPAKASERVATLIRTYLAECADQQARTRDINNWLSEQHQVTPDQAGKALKEQARQGKLLRPQTGLYKLPGAGAADSAGNICLTVAADSYGPPAVKTTGEAKLPDWEPPPLPPMEGV